MDDAVTIAGFEWSRAFPGDLFIYGTKPDIYICLCDTGLDIDFIAFNLCDGSILRVSNAFKTSVRVIARLSGSEG